ncbi:MAG: endolytic transglycosylase MltG [Chloroflexi bacterium]|nr:MAG: endolytic transglycosylase MltG [Chloroflexota bacterium]
MRKLVSALVVIALLGLGTSRALDWWNFNLNTPVSQSSQQVVFHIDQGELANQISEDLYTQRLIRDRNAFDLYVRLTNAGPKFEAGTFLLNRNMSMVQIINALEHGRPDQIVVTIPEGFPLKFQAQYVEKSGIGTAADYLTAAKDPSLGALYDFLSSRPAGADPPLEGYLFPDTYLVDKSVGMKELVKAQLNQFGNVFSPALRQQASQPTAARSAETVEAIVILASMVEREANKDSDRGNVCSVYYNRLKIGMPLGVDGTLLYALGRLTPEPTYAELQTNTPYNTRKHAGLPPGPISNPGKAALLACINPPETKYLYYFTDPQGTTHFETNQTDFCRDLQSHGMNC